MVRTFDATELGLSPRPTLIGGGQLPAVEGLAMPEFQPVDAIMPFDPLPPADTSRSLAGIDPLDAIAGINLAEMLPEATLQKIGAKVVADTDQDRDDLKPLFERLEEGAAMMGIIAKDQDDGAFPGAATVVMPLLPEAVYHHWARGFGETWPAEGPARAKVVGQRTVAADERASRVAEYLNYQMTFEDDGGYQEHSRLMMLVPYMGTAFKKVYDDADLDRSVGVCVDCTDLIVPPRATSLATAPRYTHRLFRTKNEYRRAVKAKFYRDADLGDPVERDATVVDEIKDAVAGTGAPAREESYEFYEQYVDLDLEGFEDRNDLGQKTGVALPWVVTVDKASGKVLSIYANWRPEDRMRRKRIFFIPYTFMPSHGFYGLGLIHLVGGLQKAATGALRELIDGAALASLQGGFITADANLRGERHVIEPGVWKKIDATRDDLTKAFYTPPFKEPSAAIFNLLGFLTDQAQRLVGTTDIQTGDMDAKAPVGSVIAILEQGGKIYSTIHRGYHNAMADELRLRYELARERIVGKGDGAYPYDVDGNPRQIFSQDFAPGVSIQPVSDPNIFSNTQRIALAQAALQIATQFPALHDMKKVVARLYEAMRMPDWQELMIADKMPSQADPVTENAYLMVGKPIKAYEQDNHPAHIQVHTMFMQSPQFGGNPEIAQRVMPIMAAHLGEHLAWTYRQQFQQVGVPLPPVDPMTGDYAAPPQVDFGQLAQMAAQAAPGLINAPGLPPMMGHNGGPPMSDLAMGQAKVEQIKAEGQQRLQQTQAEHEQAMAHQQQLAALKVESARLDAQLKAQQKMLEASAKAQAEAQARQMEAEKVAQQHAMDMQRAMDEAMMTEAQQQQAIVHNEEAHQQAVAQRTIEHAQARAQSAQEADQNAEIKQVEAVAKRGRGRPKGSKNKGKN